MSRRHRIFTLVLVFLMPLLANVSSSSIEDRLQRVEIELDLVKRDNSFLKTEIRDLKYEDGVSKQKIGQLIQENKSIQAAMADLKRDAQEDREEVKRLKSQLASQWEDLDEAAARIDVLNRKIEEMQLSCCVNGGITTSGTSDVVDAATTSAEMPTWPINTEIEFINIEISHARIAIFKDLNLVAMGSGGVTKIYDLRNRQIYRNFSVPSQICMEFKQNQLIVGARHHALTIWNVETGELVRTLENSNQMFSATLNKNQSLMLTGGFDLKVRLWDMVGFKEIRTFTGPINWVDCVAFHEAKSQVISGSDQYRAEIRVWNMNDGSLISRMTGHADSIRFLLVDEQTGLLYSSASDNTIKEWNTDSGELLRTFSGHSSHIYHLMWSEDGQRLVSPSTDKSIIVWDKHNGQVINRLNYTDGFYRIALNPLNGQLLSTTTQDNKLIFWPIKP